TDITGNAQFSVLGNQDGGVLILEARDNTIGGQTATPGTGPGNVISGNTSAPGIEIRGGGRMINNVQGNLIGVGKDGKTAVPNGVGVLLKRSSNVIGGTKAGFGNVISGNNFDGIRIENPGNQVQGNIIGALADGKTALLNGFDGVLITGA